MKRRLIDVSSLCNSIFNAADAEGPPDAAVLAGAEDGMKGYEV